MKKILIGLISTVLSCNVTAALLSLEIYQSELFQQSAGPSEVLASSDTPYRVDVNFEPLIYDYFPSSNSFDLYGSEAQIIGQMDTEYQSYFIDFFGYNHEYLQDFNTRRSQFDALDIAQTHEDTSSELVTFFNRFNYFEEQSKDPFYEYYQDSTNVTFEFRHNRFKTQEVNGLVSGHLLQENYRIDFGREPALDFSNFDDFEEVYAALKQGEFNDSRVNLTHYVSLISFEQTDPLVDAIHCWYCEGVTKTSDESLIFVGEARITETNVAAVPEPSTKFILVLGLLALVGLNRRNYC
ncbi:PEP-CTERM sorting domain-containing protein [Thalassomonas actiniarum]|uniref:PEP-CTERM sorting domain-containing protein n=1 Tax=Thalassomonas actiniarum TaxID=485447 RepID=A0AAE9YRZ8_9GAMM|nr:PEP-CTERM sorting domain-containing protein [Thalassomonas actiniarum]WDE00145.1 PEP-CTERM sorting domain-containing protein [Thalassomonas actiniarum]